MRPYDSLGVGVVRYTVYRTVERDISAVRAALSRLGPAVIAVHSPRAGIQLTLLIQPTRRMRLHVAAISDARRAFAARGGQA